MIVVIINLETWKLYKPHVWFFLDFKHRTWLIMRKPIKAQIDFSWKSYVVWNQNLWCFAWESFEPDTSCTKELSCHRSLSREICAMSSYIIRLDGIENCNVVVSLQHLPLKSLGTFIFLSTLSPFMFSCQL